MADSFEEISYNLPRPLQFVRLFGPVRCEAEAGRQQ
jgi:hypothetical protein